MVVKFYGNRYGNIIDKVVRWWTADFKSKIDGSWRDGYSHVELAFSNGTMFSASARYNKTSFRVTSRGKAWDDLYIRTSEEVEKRALSFCQSVVGSKYDYAGILGFVLGVKDDSAKWFCSEVVVRALQEAGVLPWSYYASDISPNALYKILEGSSYE